jgi:glucose-1-phosphate cytidylyltransferase
MVPDGCKVSLQQCINASRLDGSCLNSTAPNDSYIPYMFTAISTPVFILAGGLGTRLSEETAIRPKPMVEIGDIPILVHVMRHYYSHGFDDFVICAGYKAWEIKNFFLNYEYRMNDLVIDHREDSYRPPSCLGRSKAQERWKVRVIDTGVDCLTGGRLARAFDKVYAEEPFEEFALTYGDGLTDLNLTEEFLFHRKHKKIGTVLGVQPQSRFGILSVNEDQLVSGFVEKPQDRQEIISAGFFFFQSKFRSYLTNDSNLTLEREPLARLASEGELMVYRHPGFWHAMDTLRDKTHLEDLWRSGKAPWLATAGKRLYSQKEVEAVQ